MKTAYGKVCVFARQFLSLGVLLTCALLISQDVKGQWDETGYRKIEDGMTTIVAHGGKLFAGSNRGVHVSTDNGVTWSLTNNGLTDTNIVQLYSSSSILLASTFSGVFRSMDNGGTWTFTGLTNYVSSFAGDGAALLAGSYGLFASYDNGATWTESLNGASSGSVSALLRSDTQFIATNTLAEIWISSDLGLSWTKQFDTPNSINSMVSIGTHAFASLEGGGVLHSTDAGFTWTMLVDTLDILNVLYVTSSGTLLAASSSRIFRSTDEGIVWTRSFSSGSGVYILDLAEEGGIIFGPTYYSGLMSSDDDGMTWVDHAGGPPRAPVLSLIADGSTLVASTYQTLHRSGDGGTTWTDEAGIPNELIAELNIFGTDYFARTLAGNIYRSSDAGATWGASNNGLGVTLVNDLSAVGTRIYAATQSGVFVSVDQGSSWSMTGPSALINLKFVGAGTDGSTVYAFSELTGLYRSLDAGASWVLQNDNIPGIAATSFSMVGNIVYVGTYSGIFTVGAGNAWSLISPSLNNRAIRSMSTDGAVLYFATGSSVEIGSFSGTTLSVVVSNLGYSDVSDLLPMGSSLIVAMTDYSGSPFGKVMRATLLPQVSITSITPSAVTVGSTITIEGQNFSTSPAQNKVSFGNDFVGTVLSASTTTLQVSVPSTAGTVSVSVTVAGRTAEFVAPLKILPSLVSFSPRSGIPESYVTIYGSGFNDTGPTTLLLNGIPVGIFSNNRTSLYCQVPAQATSGFWTVISNGETLVSAAPFNVLPVIQELRPTRGLPGDPVTLIGIGFGNTPGSNVVSFNGVPALVTLHSSNYVSVIVPPGVTSGAVRVTTVGGTAYSPLPFTRTDFSINCPVAYVKPTITQTRLSTEHVMLESSSTISNQWFLNGQPIPGGNEQTLHVFSAGTYSVLFTIDGCSSPLSNLEVVSIRVTGLGDGSHPTFYPNPTTTTAYFRNLSPGGEKTHVRIMDTSGRTLVEKNSEGEYIELDVSTLAPGIYFALLDCGPIHLVQKLIKR